MNIRSKLSRLKVHTGIEEKNTVPQKGRSGGDSILLSEVEKQWQTFGAQIKRLEDQYVIVREVVYPLSDQHGEYTFSQLFDACSKWKQSEMKHPLSAEQVNSDQLIFFDTETTGLYTGAGHHIFLLGYAQVKSDGVYVKQYLLPGPESEAALYYYFLSEVDNLSHLVTYNGKAFDWPQVKTRHTFVRDQVPKLPAFGHFDLLHAARRLWSNELPSCRLPIIEEHKLDFARKHDTPSYLVPMLYFDFVKEQDPSLMEGVLKHHEWDLLSLITLYCKLSFKLTDHPEEHSNDSECYELGRWYASIGETDPAATFLKRGIKSSRGDIASKSIYEYADLLKKQKKPREALTYYQESIQLGYRVSEAALECAKMMEHFEKDLGCAIDFTQIAIDGLTSVPTKKRVKLQADLRKRMNRLETKQGKA
ncbi:ribonuclease H-like domain-containing protein [Alkalihalobacillus sp. NPDC078783]